MSPVTCPICNARDSRWHSNRGDRRKQIPGTWNYWACHNCELVFLHPLPSVRDLIGYYSTYYLGVAPLRPSKPSWGTRFPRLRNLFHAASGDVDPRDFVQFEPGSRILDYGSGLGTYMHFFKAKGAKISGVELSQTMVEQSRVQGLDVNLVDSFDKIPYSDGEFDVIFLMQVLEHLHNPHVIMEELSRVLARDGKIYIAVPNGRSIWAKVFGRHWLSGWFTPFHLFLYSSKSLGLLAAGHGLRVNRIWTRTPASWFSLNLAAKAHSTRNDIESYRGGMSARFLALITMIPLRVLELFTSENDCLVAELIKP